MDTVMKLHADNFEAPNREPQQPLQSPDEARPVSSTASEREEDREEKVVAGTHRNSKFPFDPGPPLRAAALATTSR